MSRTVILWAGSIGASSGGGHPHLMLGEPDANCYSFGPGMSATLTDFRGRFYTGLSALLGTVTHGDVVIPATLATADLIAFEGNGGSPAPSGGWESCDWYFSDSVNPPLSVLWDEAVGAARDPHILANGSISGAAYSAFFGFPTTTFLSWGIRPEDLRPEAIVVSFLLFRLRPEIDTASPFFKLRVSGTSLPIKERVREGSPDPDAIGILACHHEDDEPWKPK
jgi:hypothetical protein